MATAAARTIAKDTQQDERNVVTMTGYCGNGIGEVGIDGGGKSKGQRTMTEGYCDNGGSNDEDNSKDNSGENGERGGNSGGSASHLCLIFFWFWLGS